jgi:membrane-bound ClpP family serine protease
MINLLGRKEYAMDATIWGGMNLFSLIMLLVGIFCLIIEMFTIKPGIPAGVGFTVLIIGVLTQAVWIWEAVGMTAVICGIFGLLVTIYFHNERSARAAGRRRYRRLHIKP